MPFEAPALRSTAADTASPGPGFGCKIEGLRIAHVVRQFAPSVGGLEEVVSNLVRRQRAEGCEAHVVTLDRLFRERGRKLPAEERLEGVPVTRIPYFGSRRYPLAPAVLNRLPECDLVHVHGIDFFFDYLAWTSPLHRKTMVATTHGGFFHTSFAAALKRRYFTSVTRLAARAYERIVACSPSDAERFCTIAPGKVVTIENGVDLHKLRGSASPDYRRSLIYFGRLSANKRIAAIFPILRHLRATAPEWCLTVAGREDDVSIDELRQQAASQGIGHAVRFVCAPDDRALATLVRDATFFISTSAYEGFGVAAVEAMSAGLFPILSRIPPFERFIRLAGAGILIDPPHPHTAARLILDLDAQLRARLEAAREKLIGAAQLFDWSHVNAAYFAVYQAALQSWHQRSQGSLP